MDKNQRLAVVVLGMHRSGTSATAGAAIHMGLAPPLRQIPAAPDNPSGFYESVAVAGLNQILLKAVGCTWFDCLSLDPDCFDAPAAAATLDLGRRILLEDFGDAPAFVIKDPRLCLTLPVWLPVFRAAQARVAVVLVLRHPDEVARSLARRDILPDHATAAVWLHHMLEAERLTRGLPRAVVLYDELLRDWRACLTRAGQEAGIAWPGASEDAGHSAVDRFLSRGLRHHFSFGDGCTLGPAALRPMLSATWTTLRDDAASPRGHARLDEVRAAFREWRRWSAPGVLSPAVAPAAWKPEPVTAR